MESPTSRRIRTTSSLRITLLQLVVLIVFLAFGFRLWSLQVVAGEQYREAARRNRTRLINTDASRGIMYDRTGELLVRNIPRFNVLLIPAYLPSDEKAKEAILQRLHELLDVPLVSQYAPSPFPPYTGEAKLGLRDLVEEGELYDFRVRSRDRAGNEGYGTSDAYPLAVAGDIDDFFNVRQFFFECAPRFLHLIKAICSGRGTEFLAKPEVVVDVLEVLPHP